MKLRGTDGNTTLIVGSTNPPVGKVISLPGPPGTTTWTGLTGKPTTFPPDLTGVTQDSIPDGTTAKQYTATEKTKLSGIATGATANATDAQLRDRSTHTGTQSADTLTDGTTNKAYTAAEKTKLSGVATGATANDTDANLKNRANHTGTQLASTISDFSTAADARITASTKVNGSVNGTATALTLWTGTQAQYTALGTYNSNTVYVVMP
jgi:hypothetical protein